MAGEPDDKKDPDDPAKGKDDKQDDDDLGDSGKSALDKERKARRDAEKRARDAEAKLKEHDDAEKTASEQLVEAKADVVKERQRADRLQVAIDKGLTSAQAKRLSGDTLEALEADADEILELFGTKKPDEGTDTDKKDDDAVAGGMPTRQPSPDLKGGSDPTRQPDEIDVAKLADAIPRP